MSGPDVDKADNMRKRYESLRALGALSGIRIYKIEHGYLASMGAGWCRELPDLPALAELLRRNGRGSR